MDSNKAEAMLIGLCASCQHAQRIKSDRGSEFVRCGRAATDPRFIKYPRLPVTQCMGYDSVVSS